MDEIRAIRKQTARRRYRKKNLTCDKVVAAMLHDAGQK